MHSLASDRCIYALQTIHGMPGKGSLLHLSSEGPPDTRRRCHTLIESMPAADAQNPRLVGLAPAAKPYSALMGACASSSSRSSAMAKTTSHGRRSTCPQAVFPVESSLAVDQMHVTRIRCLPKITSAKGCFGGLCTVYRLLILLDLQNTDDLVFGEPAALHLCSPRLGQSLRKTALGAGGNVSGMAFC